MDGARGAGAANAGWSGTDASTGARGRDGSGGTAANDEPSTSQALAADPTTSESIAAAPTTAEALAGVGSMDAAANAARAGTTDAATAGAAPAAEESLVDEGLAAAQGTSAFAAREGTGAAAARESYQARVSALAPDDRAGRTAVKADVRAMTPPATRAAIAAARPDLGPRPGSVGSAARTNAGADALAKNLGRVGRASAVAGVALGGARIALADDKVLESARVGGGALGGIAAGALVGTQLGALGANPLTIAGGALIGAAIGGIAGEKAVDAAVGWVRSWF